MKTARRKVSAMVESLNEDGRRSVVGFLVQVTNKMAGAGRGAGNELPGTLRPRLPELLAVDTPRSYIVAGLLLKRTKTREQKSTSLLSGIIGFVTSEKSGLETFRR